MDLKIMGNFIAELRKTAGMTQKDVADRLSVSDKAVSRWERGENYPDISMLPVLADLFGVSADELLRGERIENAAANNTFIPKQEELTNQQKETISNESTNLLCGVYAHYRTYMWVSVALFVIGSSTVLFLIGVLFIIAGIILLMVQHSIAKNKVRNATLPLDERTKAAFMAKVNASTCQVVVIPLFVILSYGLVFLGFLIESHCVRNGDRGYIVTLLVSLLGTSISYYSAYILPLNMVIPIVLANIWILYHYNKRFFDLVFQSGVEDRVHTLAKKSLIMGGIVVGISIVTRIFFISLFYIISSEQRMAILKIDNSYGFVFEYLLLPILIILISIIYHRKRKQFERDIFYHKT